MMGRLNHDQEQFFYSFRLDEAVPNDHPVREVAAVLDLSWVHSELVPYYSPLGRPSIDPVLMIRILIVGNVFAIRSERALCRDVGEPCPLKYRLLQQVPVLGSEQGFAPFQSVVLATMLCGANSVWRKPPERSIQPWPFAQRGSTGPNPLLKECIR
jgi:Transposase domain (DUF772)